MCLSLTQQSHIRYTLFYTLIKSLPMTYTWTLITFPKEPPLILRSSHWPRDPQLLTFCGVADFFLFCFVFILLCFDFVEWRLFCFLVGEPADGMKGDAGLQTLWKTVWRVLKNQNNYHRATIPFQVIYLGEKN